MRSSRVAQANRPNHDRSLTAAGFARLLATLDADRDRAALAYERLRRALVKFFDWRGARPPDECADDTLDRLARRLEDGTRVEDVYDYAYGIARLVLLEWRRRPVTTNDVPESAAASASPVDDFDDVRRCLDRCLDEEPAAARALMLRYYEGEQHEKIANRRRIAGELGLSDAGLRSRIHRLRERLERCVRGCAARGERRLR